MSECTIPNAFFSKHSLFGGLTNEELDAIRPHLDQRICPALECILMQGEPNNTVYFIVSGSVSIQKHREDTHKGPERQITILHEGDSFGEMELIDIQPCAASAVCLEETTLVTLSNRDLYLLSKTHLMTYTMIIMNLAREISRRLRSTDSLLVMASAKSSRKARG